MKTNWNRSEHIKDIQRIAKLLFFSPNVAVDFTTEEELFEWIETRIDPVPISKHKLFISNDEKQRQEITKRIIEGTKSF